MEDGADHVAELDRDAKHANDEVIQCRTETAVRWPRRLSDQALAAELASVVPFGPSIGCPEVSFN
jgi:hypothetical protein